MGFAVAHAATGTARPEARPHCWLWARPLPLERVPDTVLRSRLAPGAALLLASLSGHERSWRRVSYFDLQRRLGLTQRQLSRRVRALRDAGLVEARVRRAESNVYELDTGLARGSHGTAVWLRPRASCMVPRDGAEAPVLYAPSDALEAMMKRETRGGARPGAGRKRKSNRRVTSAAEPANYAEAGGAEAVGGNQTGAFYRSKDLEKESTSPEGKGSASPEPAGGLSLEPEEWDGFDLNPPADRRRPLPLDQRGPRPSIPRLDKPAVRYPDLRVRLPEPGPMDRPREGESSEERRLREDRLALLREAQVTLMARGYEQALRKVYGDSRRFYARDVSRMRAYPALVEVAEMLVENDIPPGEWAEWRLSFAKARGEEPWNFTRVFQVATVKKWRGFFRRQFKSSPEARQDWKPYHDEQRHRAREAELRWAWGDDPPMLSFPKSYTEMRARERRLGAEFADPLYNWPSPGNSPGGEM